MMASASDKDAAPIAMESARLTLLAAENAELRRRLAQAEAALNALRQASASSVSSPFAANQALGESQERQRLAMQLAVTRVLAESPSLDEAAPEILRGIVQTLGWETSALWRTDAEGSELTLVEAWSAGEEAREFIEGSRSRRFARGEGLPGRVWATNQPVWALDVQRDGHFPRAPLAEAAGLHGAFAFPARARGQTVAVIECFSREAHEPDEALLATLEGIGAQIGQFIERRAAESALRDREERLRDRDTHLRLAMNASLAIVFEWDIVRDRVQRLLSTEEGLPPTGDRRDSFEDVVLAVHPDDRDSFRAQVRAALEAPDGGYGSEFRIRRLDGETRWLSETGRVEFDAEGRPTRLIGISLDITTRKKAEEARDQSAALLRAISEHSADIIFAKDAAGRLLFVNPAVERYFGEPAQDLIGKDEFHFLADREAAEAIRANDRRIMETGRAETVEEPISLHGERRTFISTKASLRGPDGAVIGLIGISHDVSDLKRAEDALRASEERFRTSLLHSPAPALLFDDQGRVLSISESWIQCSGYSREELTSLADWTSLAYGEQGRDVLNRIRQIIDDEPTSRSAERAIRTRTGELRLWSFATSAIGPQRDGRRLFLTMAHDITERKRAEEALRRSRERLAMAMNTASIYSWEIDVADETIHWSENAASILGFPTESMPKTLGEALRHHHPDDAELVLRAMERALGGFADRASFEQRIIHPLDGSIIWVQVQGVVESAEDGKPARLVGLSQNITERKRAEEQLRASEENFRAMFEVASVGKAQADPFTGRFLRVNAAFAAMVGYSEPELLGKTVSEITHPEDRESDDQRFRRMAAGQAVSHQSEKRYLRSDGSIIWVQVDANLIRDGAGRPLRTAAVIQDITARKRGEANAAFLDEAASDFSRLSAAEDIMQAVAARSSAFLNVAIVGFAEIFEDCDEARMLSLRRQPNAPRFLETMETIRLSREFGGELRRACRAGETVVIRDARSDPRCSPSDDGCVVSAARSAVIAPFLRQGRWRFAMVAADASPRDWRTDEIELVRDIASRLFPRLERARAEDALRKADRRKDEFLAMLAHELRNPLAPIRNSVEILRMVGPQEPVLHGPLCMIERQVAQLVRLVDGLLDVARVSLGKIALQTAVLDLADVARQAAETSRPHIVARRQQLDVSLPSSPIRIEGDFARLVQVVNNLLNNAAKYTDEGGWIALSVENGAMDSDLNLNPNLNSDFGPKRLGEAVIRVRDNGRGIDAKTQENLFDMFYQADPTLDRAEGGLGIGLALVKSLVEMHNGRVSAFSGGPGQGSEFIIRLPYVIDEPARMAAPNAQGPRTAETDERGDGQPSRCRILVVDDNIDAAFSMSKIFEHDGHDVMTAYDGESAVEIALRERPGVILLDIGLPRLDGYQACRAMREGGLAQTKIIAVTGYGTDEDRRRSREAGFDSHQVKPVDIGVLKSLVTAACSATGPAPAAAPAASASESQG